MTPAESVPVPHGTLSPPVRTLSESEMVFVNRLVNLEQVLPNVTHELNNALQVISGLSEILSIRPDVNDDAAPKLQRMHAQAIRCCGLLRELLSYARRDDVKHITDVGRAIDRALDLRRFHLSRAHVTVAIEPGPSGVVAAMDSQHFEQLLLNLILNAEQAMAGRPDALLTLRCAQHDDDVVISVADTGPGVDLATVEATCFAPFWTSRPGMLGLGLPVARVLAAAARGTVVFVAPSRVEVRLPAR